MPLYFFLLGRPGFFCDDGECVTCFCLWCWHGRSEINFGEDRATEERATCPSINKNLVSGSLLCRDSFKVVLESNKFIVSRCGQFIGKVYAYGCLFRFSVSDFCNKSVNNICDSINESDASIWHSRLCHLNFGSMSPLSRLNLILNLSIVKCSKFQSCVQSKQHRKPHKAAEERHLAPLELIYSDICEMNDVLIEGEQRYFMTMIDDAYRYYYVYLLKTKDELLNCFKTY
jgi:hypothetical protein